MQVVVDVAIIIVIIAIVVIVVVVVVVVGVVVVVVVVVVVGMATVVDSRSVTRTCTPHERHFREQLVVTKKRCCCCGTAALPGHGHSVQMILCLCGTELLLRVVVVVVAVVVAVVGKARLLDGVVQSLLLLLGLCRCHVRRVEPLGTARRPRRKRRRRAAADGGGGSGCSCVGGSSFIRTFVMLSISSSRSRIGSSSGTGTSASIRRQVDEDLNRKTTRGSIMCYSCVNVVFIYNLFDRSIMCYSCVNVVVTYKFFYNRPVFMTDYIRGLKVRSHRDLDRIQSSVFNIQLCDFNVIYGRLILNISG